MKRRLAWVLGIVALIAAIYAGPVSAWITAQDDRAQAIARLDATERTLRSAERQVARLRAPGMLEQEARRLGMARPGETMVVIEPARAAQP